MIGFAIVLLIIGIVKRQGWSYSVHVIGALVLQGIMASLFDAERGILMSPVRQHVGNGLFLTIAVPIVILAWALPIAVVRRGYEKPLPKEFG